MTDDCAVQNLVHASKSERIGRYNGSLRWYLLSFAVDFDFCISRGFCVRIQSIKCRFLFQVFSEQFANIFILKHYTKIKRRFEYLLFLLYRHRDPRNPWKAYDPSSGVCFVIGFSYSQNNCWRRSEIAHFFTSQQWRRKSRERKTFRARMKHSKLEFHRRQLGLTDKYQEKDGICQFQYE